MVAERDLFYNATDVAGILFCCKRKAYAVIASLNRELRKQGYIIKPGIISKKYFHKRYQL